MPRRVWTEDDWDRLEAMDAAGRAPSDIARDMGWSVKTIFAKRTILIHEGRPPPRARPLRDVNPMSYHLSRDRVAWRKCLGGCGKPFESYGPQNRICTVCKGSPAFAGESALA